MYHDYESLSEAYAQKPEGGLNLMHFNIRSLTKNFSAFHDIVSNLPNYPDIICISETKLSDYNINTDPNSGEVNPSYESEIDIELPNFSFLCNNSKSPAGGTGIYVNNALVFKNRPDLEPNIEGCEGNFIEVIRGTNLKSLL